jgi:hypothetical protein
MIDQRLKCDFCSSGVKPTLPTCSIWRERQQHPAGVRWQQRSRSHAAQWRWAVGRLPLWWAAAYVGVVEVAWACDIGHDIVSVRITHDGTPVVLDVASSSPQVGNLCHPLPTPGWAVARLH